VPIDSLAERADQDTRCIRLREGSADTASFSPVVLSPHILGLREDLVEFVVEEVERTGLGAEEDRHYNVTKKTTVLAGKIHTRYSTD